MDLRQFVTEGKAEEDIKRRQAEWERVRKPSDPIEAPAEVFDNRTLYDKLKEQHEIKKKSFEDQYALKNLVRGIDTDEAQFLDEVDKVKSKYEQDKREEEKKEINEYRKALEEEKKGSNSSSMPKIHVSVPKKVRNQSELLSKVVLKRKKSDLEEVEDEVVKKNIKLKQKPIIAILPGVGEYNTNSSSSSDYSSDDEIDHVTSKNIESINANSLFSSQTETK